MATLFVGCRRAAGPCRSQKPIGSPDRRKTLRDGIEMATFGDNVYVAGYGETPLMSIGSFQLTSNDVGLSHSRLVGGSAG